MGELWVGIGTQGVDGLFLIRMIFQTDRCGNVHNGILWPAHRARFGHISSRLRLMTYLHKRLRGRSCQTVVGEEPNQQKDRLKCASTGELLIAFFNLFKAA